jgi:hypothetical protein
MKKAGKAKAGIAVVATIPAVEQSTEQVAAEQVAAEQVAVAVEPEVVVEPVVVEQPTIVVGAEIEVKQLGRPTNPDSVRQKRLAEMEAKRVAGELKRGRPVNGESERQKRLAEMAAKAELNGGVLKRGRPVNGGSERQKRLAEMEAKRAAGTLKRGRPAFVKVDAPVIITEEVVEQAVAPTTEEQAQNKM